MLDLMTIPKRNEWIDLVFGMEIFVPVLHCVLRKFSLYKNKGYFPVELFRKLRLKGILPQHIDR